MRTPHLRSGRHPRETGATRRTLGRAGVPLLLVACFLAPSGLAAGAASSGWVLYWSNGPDCVYDRSRFESANNGQNNAEVRHKWPAGTGTNCLHSYAAPGALQARFENWAGSGLCTYTPNWSYNSGTSGTYRIYSNNAAVCGYGLHYRTVAWGNWWTGAGWVGNGSPGVTGGLSSGSVLMP